MYPDLPKSGGAKGNRTPDLLDANENHWAFVTESCVGCAMNLQFRLLAMLVAENLVKFCCGLTADWTERRPH
jgi:hypothetical protein